MLGGVAAWLVLGGTLCVVGLGLLFPDGLGPFLAKEGAIEHLSHGVLAVGIVAWGASAARHRRVPPACLALFLLLVLAEELDWGLVYGWPAGASVVRAVGGDRNLHNLLGGHSYVLFALPLVALYGCALLPEARRRVPERWFGRTLPPKGDAWAFFVLCPIAVLLPEALESRAAMMDEVFETGLYVLVLVTGIRGLATPPVWRPARQGG